MSAAKSVSSAARGSGAASLISASRSPASRSATTRNSACAMLCASASRAPRPPDNRYRPPAPRDCAMRSGYANASKSADVSVRLRGARASSCLLPAAVRERRRCAMHVGARRRRPERRPRRADRRRARDAAPRFASANLRRAGRAPAQQIAFAQNCGDLQREALQAELGPAHDHVGEPRMRAQSRQRAAMRRDATFAVDRIERAQQVPRLRERRGRRRIEPAQRARIARRPTPRARARRARGLLRGFPARSARAREACSLSDHKPVAHARAEASRAPATLIGRRARDAHGLQAAHSRRRDRSARGGRARSRRRRARLRSSGWFRRCWSRARPCDAERRRGAMLRPAPPPTDRRTAAARSHLAADRLLRAVAARGESPLAPARTPGCRPVRCSSACAIVRAVRVAMSISRCAARSQRRRRAQRVSTGNILPSAVTTGALPSSCATAAASSVADITRMRRSSRTSACASRHSARPRSALRLRSWNSSKITIATPSSVASRCSQRVRIPSVTTSMRVLLLVRDSSRVRKPTVWPTASPSICAMRVATARAARRRGSSITILPLPSDFSASSASGTPVDLPAPGGACNTTFACPANGGPQRRQHRVDRQGQLRILHSGIIGERSAVADGG